jgi:hypothetical protein
VELQCDFWELAPVKVRRGVCEEQEEEAGREAQGWGRKRCGLYRLAVCWGKSVCTPCMLVSPPGRRPVRPCTLLCCHRLQPRRQSCRPHAAFLLVPCRLVNSFLCTK